MGFLAEAVALYRAEQALKRGEIGPEAFLEVTDGMTRSEDAFRFFRATVLSLLHIPVIQLPWLVGLGLVVPLLAVLLTGPDPLRLVFVIYASTRLLVGIQDAVVMTWAHRSGFIPFNSSLTGTILGTLPYPHSYAVGPLVWTAVEIGLYLVVTMLPGMFGQVEAVVPGLLAAISTAGLLQIVVHTAVRGGVNLLIVWEMPRLSDPDTFHRIRSTTWRVKNRLLGRGDDEIETAETLWEELREDLRGEAWARLDEETSDLDPDEQERVQRYLLTSRKDEMLLKNLLTERGSPA